MEIMNLVNLVPMIIIIFYFLNELLELKHIESQEYEIEIIDHELAYIKQYRLWTCIFKTDLSENIQLNRLIQLKHLRDFSLVYEIVYWMLTPDYNTYMDVQQTINLEIYRTFAEQKIEFAYPTQTVYMNKA